MTPRPITDTGLAVDVQSVSKTYPIGFNDELHALDDVTLALHAREAVAIQGPSGSGKSTLLHVIGGMDVADSGAITVGDTDVTALSRRDLTLYRRRIGFVFQRFHLLPALTLLDNVVAPVLPYKTDFDPHQRATELLDAVGLADRSGAPPSRLSGGQQQRVAIARALINRPGLVLADEPTGNLDSVTGATIVDLLLDIRWKYGTTVVIATHDATVAARCDRVVTITDGRLGGPPRADSVGVG